MVLGINFGKCGILRSSIPSLLVSMGIDVELLQEVLDIALAIYGLKSILEVLSECRLLVAVLLACWISYNSTT